MARAWKIRLIRFLAEGVGANTFKTFKTSKTLLTTYKKDCFSEQSFCLEMRVMRSSCCPSFLMYQQRVGEEFMTTAQISERLVTCGNIKKPMTLSRLGVLMSSMGYRSVQRQIGCHRGRGWIVYQRDTDEILSMRRLLIQ